MSRLMIAIFNEYIRKWTLTTIRTILIVLIVALLGDKSNVFAQQLSWDVVIPAYSDGGVYCFRDLSASDENNCTVVGYQKKDGKHRIIFKRTTSTRLLY